MTGNSALQSNDHQKNTRDTVGIRQLTSNEIILHCRSNMNTDQEDGWSGYTNQ